MNNQTKIIIFLLFVILVFTGLWVHSNLKDKYTTEGIEQGVQQAVLSIAQQSMSCQPVTLTIGEQTIRLINLECYDNQQA